MASGSMAAWSSARVASGSTAASMAAWSSTRVARGSTAASMAAWSSTRVARGFDGGLDGSLDVSLRCEGGQNLLHASDPPIEILDALLQRVAVLGRPPSRTAAARVPEPERRRHVTTLLRKGGAGARSEPPPVVRRRGRVRHGEVEPGRESHSVRGAHPARGSVPRRASGRGRHRRGRAAAREAGSGVPGLCVLPGDGGGAVGPVPDGLRLGRGLLRRRAPGPRGPAERVRALQVGGAVRRVRPLRCSDGSRAAGRRGLGPRPAAGDQRLVGGRGGVRRLALVPDGPPIPPAERGGVGVRGARGNDDVVRLGSVQIGNGHRANCDRLRQPMGRRRGRPPPARSRPTRGACATCTATCGNGWRTAGTRTTPQAPADGSARTRGGDCGYRVLRGGSWFSLTTVDPASSAFRLWEADRRPGRLRRLSAGEDARLSRQPSTAIPRISPPQLHALRGCPATGSTPNVGAM